MEARPRVYRSCILFGVTKDSPRVETFLVFDIELGSVGWN
jgi:hypothetical protein